MTDKAQPWDAFLRDVHKHERYDVLPGELRTAIDGLISAAVRLYEDTYSDPFSVDDEVAERVQAQPSSPSGRRVKKNRSHQKTFLERTLPNRLNDLSDDMRQRVAGVEEPRTGPRFRTKSA